MLYSEPVKLSVWFSGGRANADIDNLLKSVLDAIQGVIIVDDKQVQMVEARKEPTDGEPPSTHIQIGPYRNGDEGRCMFCGRAVAVRERDVALEALGEAQAASGEYENRWIEAQGKLDERANEQGA